MCGRYMLFDDEGMVSLAYTAWLADAFGLIGRPEADAIRAQSTGEVRPNQRAPVRVQGETGLRWMTWGFPNPRSMGLTINARAETAATKGLFRVAMRQRRIAVPALGFFEWRHNARAKSKDPYLFRIPEQERMWMAGAYTGFQTAGGGMVDRFVILTAPADPVVAAYHDRMPVLLREAEADAWLAAGEGWRQLLERATWVHPEAVPARGVPPLPSAQAKAREALAVQAPPPCVSAEPKRGSVQQQSLF
ncbi:MAG: SOS response-associated peptidase family protein [Clostridia bacterium]|nr:SOS response-associated peptidase family protein [Clostridia bacterium]